MDTMAGEPCLYLWDIHVEEPLQRKGLGKHLLTLLELIARREKMRMLCFPVQLNDEVALSWISKAKGFAPDATLESLLEFDAEMEGFEVYAKTLAPPQPKPTSETIAVSTPTKAGKAGEAASPCGVMDGIAEPQTEVAPLVALEATDADDSDEAEISLQDLDEHDVINGLKAMFLEKNNREPTEEETLQWLDEIRKVLPSTSSIFNFILIIKNRI